ncbi:MAG: NAD(P)H-dependent oxidoreductase [Prevotellaceae bacterium]|jgi:chromate reductase|nr:NAD(P)H-dependent oxidoreductase [Prevotellaceae bacterium]
MKTLVLIGGISQNSLSKTVYNQIVKHNNTNLTFGTFDISALPYFSQDLENNPPQTVKDLQNAVKQADAVIFITPEYNRSFPGVLKNAIDWATRPYGQNLWNEKPAAIVGVSLGKIGGFGAVQHLKNVCSFLNMNVMNQPEVYLDASSSMENGEFVPDTVEFLQMVLKNFENWVEKTK